MGEMVWHDSFITLYFYTEKKTLMVILVKGIQDVFLLYYNSNSKEGVSSWNKH